MSRPEGGVGGEVWGVLVKRVAVFINEINKITSVGV